MSGFKMPIVCKEIYIPISDDDNGLTLDQYKEKYGIDLRDYFTFGSSRNDIGLLGRGNETKKLYIVKIGNLTYFNNGVIPVREITHNDNLFILLEGNFDDTDSEDGSFRFNIGYLLEWDHTDKVIKIVEP